MEPKNIRPKPNFEYDADVRIDNIVDDIDDIVNFPAPAEPIESVAESIEPIAEQIEPIEQIAESQPPISLTDAFFADETRQLEPVKPPAPVLEPLVESTQQIEPIILETPPAQIAPIAVKPTKKKVGAANSQKRKKREKPESSLEKVESVRKKKALEKRLKRRDEHVRTFSHIMGSISLVVIIVLTAAFISQFLVRAFIDFTGISNSAEFELTIKIPANATTAEIAEILSHNDIISMPGFFSFYTRITGREEGTLITCEVEGCTRADCTHSILFQFNSTMSYGQIINTLQSRPQSTETVTVKIIEGMTAREIAQLLEEHNVCFAEDFMQFYREQLNVFNFERRSVHNPLRFNQMEGYLFPETHEFFIAGGDLEENEDIDTTPFAEAAARTIFAHMNSQLTPEIYRRISDLGETLPMEFGLDEFMTLASMVQWEAAEPEDMRKVAGVFLNRLWNPETFPRLESDVTEKYANESIRPYLNRENSILINSMLEAYNTYESAGLPPGPVNNPGMDAMLAVLDAQGAGYDYFYFCSDIETGEMFFAETLSEHEENLVKANIDINALQ
jgi:UPF0755 protein